MRATLGRVLLSAGLVLVGCRGSKVLEPVDPDRVPAKPTTPSPTTAAASGLVPFAGDGFTILLPGPAETQKKIIQTAAGPVENTTVTAGQDLSLYAVSYYPLPARGADLDGGARGAAESQGGTLGYLRPVTFKGYVGREYRVDRENGETTIFGRSLLVEQRIFLVQVAVVGAPSAPPKLYSQVLESLSFD